MVAITRLMALLFAAAFAIGSPCAAQIWKAVGHIPSPSAIRDLCFVDAQHGFAVDNGGSVFRSDDGGSSWTSVSTTSLAGAMHVRFVNDNEGVVVCWQSLPGFGALLSLYHCTDGGRTWTLVFEDADSIDGGPFVRAASVRDSNRIVLTGQGSVYLSDDGGTTWIERAIDSPDTEGHRENWMGVATHADSIWICGPASRAVFRSTDQGLSWERLGGAVDAWQGIARSGDGTLYGVSIDRVYRSVDGGASWESTFLNRDLYPGATIGQVVGLPNGEALVSAGNVIFRAVMPLALIDDGFESAQTRRPTDLTCLSTGLCWAVDERYGEVYRRQAASGTTVPEAAAKRELISLSYRARQLFVERRRALGSVRVAIITSLGHRILSDIMVAGHSRTEVNLSDLPAGVYYATACDTILPVVLY